MLRRRQLTEPTPLYMDPELIGSLDLRVQDKSRSPDFFVSAVLFGTGEVQRLHTIGVYGLILAGYQGLHFGDDGTSTGIVASELQLNRIGIRRIEDVVDEAVRTLNPLYCAEYLGDIAMDEAAARLDIEVKKAMGVAVPAQVTWSNGSLST